MRSRCAAVDEGLEVGLHNQAWDQSESVASCKRAERSPPKTSREPRDRVSGTVSSRHVEALKVATYTEHILPGADAP
jgi:hypothetical protein